MLCLINLLLIDVLVAVAVAVVVTKTPKYPPKGRWIVVYIPRREESMCLSSAVHRPWGGCFGIYQISWIKMTKGFFFLSRKFVHNLHGFRGFCQVHFCDLVANWTSVKIIFWPPVNTDKPKFVAFLVFFLYDCFIYRSNFVFRKFLETRRHLGSVAKQWIAKDIQSYWSQQKRAEIDDIRICRWSWGERHHGMIARLERGTFWQKHKQT